ncbi:sensor histidine kinase [Eubacteriales bacterium mix99]
MTEFFRRFRIRNRIGAVLLVGLLLFSMMIFQTAKFASQKIIYDYMHGYIAVTHTEMMEGIELLMDEANMFAVRLLASPEIYNLFNDPLSFSERQGKLSTILGRLLIHDDTVGGIDIIGEDGEQHGYFPDGNSISGPDEEYLQRIRKSRSPVVGSVKKDAEGNSFIQLGRRYRNFYTGQEIGYLILLIRESAIRDIYGEAMKEWGYSFLISDSGEILSHPDQSKTGKILLSEGLFGSDELSGSDHPFDHQVIRDVGKSTILAVYPFEGKLKKMGMNWTIVSFISKEILADVINEINKYIFLSEIAIMLAVVFLAVQLSSGITRPITDLRDDVIALGSDNMNVKYEGNSGDEIWELEKSFNEMTQKIRNLIRRNNEEKEKQREMELTALQAQINPHFVYNTLDAIGWMAKLKKQPEIERMIMALSTFFRISLHKGEKYITVRDELDHVRSYVTIEEMRFPDMFDIQYHVSSEMQEGRMIKIILQPLVENAIRHGISEKEGKGHIVVNGRQDADDLLFEVIDDGVGFDTSSKDFQLTYFREKHKGYGLRNVDERIRLEYGPEYGLTVESEKGKGTRVSVRLKVR